MTDVLEIGSRGKRREVVADEPPAFVDVTDVDALTAGLKVYQPSFSALVKDTVLIRVSISCERGRMPLNASLLGLASAPAEVHAFCADHVKFGAMSLMDPVLYKQFQSKEERMRQILREYGIQTPWGGCAVPKRLYLECTRRLDEIKADIEAIFQKMLDTYDEWVEELVTSYRTWARVRYGIQNGERPEIWFAEGAAPQPSAEILAAREADIERFVAYIRQRVPSRVQMQRKFKVEWVASRISNPRALLAGEDLEKLEQEKLRLEAVIDGIDTEAARQEARLRLRAVEENLAVERDMHRRSQESIERLYKEEVGQVLAEASAQIRDEIYTVTREVLDVVTKGGMIQQRNLDRLTRLIEYTQGIGLGDKDAMKLLDPIRELIAAGPTNDKVSVAQVREVLDDVACVARAEVYSLDRRPRLEQKADPSTLPVLDMKRARGVRARLGIERNVVKAPDAGERRGGRRRAL